MRAKKRSARSTSPSPRRGDFHNSSNDPGKIAFLKSGAFCNACHDVRIPNNNLTALEFNINPGGAGVHYYRLENLSTEWQIGPYNSTANPFGKVVVCQDCHMSQFPFSQNSTYQVGDMTVTTPDTRHLRHRFCRGAGVSTDGNYPLQQRSAMIPPGLAGPGTMLVIPRSVGRASAEPPG